MKISFSGSAVLGVYGLYKELWSEVPGTGQSIMALMKAGYSRLAIARYFPFTLINIGILLIALTWAGIAWKKSQKTEP